MRNLALPFLLAAIPTATATADLTWFTSESEFEAFVLDQGNFLTGIENYEESTVPWSGVDYIPDPLEPGVPNGPFPNGLEGVDNMIVQANILGGAPDVPAPHSPAMPSEDGLAVAAGSQWIASDIVVPNYSADSHDLIFLDLNITAVGFDPMAFWGSSGVDIRVYDTSNNFLGMINSPADSYGQHFAGVWSTAPIGRINIHDPDVVSEGADNIQIWASPGKPVCGDGLCDPVETCESCTEDCGPCPFCGDGNVDPGEECDPPGFPSLQCPHQGCLDDCTCGDVCGDGNCTAGEHDCSCPQDCPSECPCVQFGNRLEFEAFNEDQGQILKGIEDFEESTLPPGSVLLLDDPLCGGIPNVDPATGWGFPDGLSESNLCVQSNIDGESAPAPNPRGIDGLATASASPGLWPISDVVVAYVFMDSLDLMFSDNCPSGVGLNTMSMLGGNNVHISIFDKNGNLLLEADSPTDFHGTNFWGVWCSDSIGRINIFDPGNGAEGGDNIQMWVEGYPCGDCPTDVDGSGDTGAADLAVLLGAWGPCAPGWVCACLDANDDGMIGAEDLAVLLGAWGPCP